MRYQFKQAVHIANKDGKNGKDYARGLHEVPEDHEYSPMFIKFVGLGLIVEPEQSVLIAAETPKQRAEKLHNRIIAEANAKASKKQPVVPVPSAPAAPVEPVKTEVEASEVEASKEEEKPSAEKKSKKK